jgi:hypothetical protein
LENSERLVGPSQGFYASGYHNSRVDGFTNKQKDCQTRVAITAIISPVSDSDSVKNDLSMRNWGVRIAVVGDRLTQTNHYTIALIKNDS